MVEAKSLKKAVVPATLFEHPSPGNLQSTRLALHVNGTDGDSCWVYIASGCRIYKLLISTKNSSVCLGKEDLLIPEQTEVLDSAVVNRCPHRSEIQSIVLAETESTGCSILGSVDSYGHVIVSKLKTCGEGRPFQSLPGIVVLEKVAGLACASIQLSGPWQLLHTVLARALMSMTKIFIFALYARKLRYPTSLTFMQNLSGQGESSILAITEGCQLSIWDLRTKENGGCVHRICGTVGDIWYAVCNSSNGTIAVGGADRTVSVYDPRRWATLSRWLNCSKYEITRLAFSSVDSDYIYVQGVDYEVLCGQWRDGKKAFSFRGDSNWLGFNKCSDRDLVGGWCDSGSLFVADILHFTSKEISDLCNIIRNNHHSSSLRFFCQHRNARGRIGSNKALLQPSTGAACQHARLDKAKVFKKTKVSMVNPQKGVYEKESRECEENKWLTYWWGESSTPRFGPLI
nr:CCR4-associated factor like [Ipomoea batatas]